MTTPHQLLLQDKEYLLRCALTFNWESLIEFCEITLLDVLKNDSFSRRRRIQKYIDAAKEQLTRRDQWGNTALHAACYNNPPLRVVTSLLQCASAANLSGLHLSLSRDLSTPLNIACATGASTDVIRVLLTPPAGLVPGGSAVTLPDARGCTPLSELVIHYELQRKSPYYARTAPSLDRLDLVVTGESTLSSSSSSSTSSSSSSCKDDCCVDPFFESFWIKVDLIIRAAWLVETADQVVSTSSSSSCCCSTNNNNNNNNNNNKRRHRPWISVLHGAAYVSESCPAVLMSLICRSYPAMIGYNHNNKSLSNDNNELLPLHLAILGNKRNNNNSIVRRNNKQSSPTCCYQHKLATQKTKWIKLLSEVYPKAVQIPFPKTGRSVFCQATAMGLSWNLMKNDNNGNYDSSSSSSSLPYQYLDDDNDNDNEYHHFDKKCSSKNNKGPLRYLWKHDPDALSTPDVLTGLVPFLLAATVGSSSSSSSSSLETIHKTSQQQQQQQQSNNNNNGIDDILQVDTIFELLRCHPQVLGDVFVGYCGGATK